jgi:hypothetical protein
MTISTRTYRRYLEQLEISQGRASKMLGLSPRTGRRYALREVAIPEPVNIVLRLMLKHGITPEEIEELRKEKPP